MASRKGRRQKPISLHPLGFEEALEGLLQVKPEVAMSEPHIHYPHTIWHTEGLLGYQLATCRDCNFVAQAKLDKPPNYTRWEILEPWREPTAEEKRAFALLG